MRKMRPGKKRKPDRRSNKTEKAERRHPEHIKGSEKNRTEERRNKEKSGRGEKPEREEDGHKDGRDHAGRTGRKDKGD